MRAWRPLLETVHIVMMGIWLGGLLAATAVAAIIFPAMKQLEPALPGYAAYTGDHSKLAAGHVGAKLFLAVDLLQLVCAVAGGAALGVLVLGKSLERRAATTVRLVAFALAAALLTFGLAIFTPSMTRPMREYWAAAERGDNEVALAHRAKFAPRHTTAAGLLFATTGCVGLSLTAGAWSLARRRVAIGQEPRP
ncbi:MAG: hypothetical protein H7Y88_04220 [Phycisphaerales bacterium]|nr:hypothetical protein [Phycisphaerales bacterium]